MILPAGLACLAATVERLGAPHLQVTGRGLRHGVVRALLARSA
jgi:exopolyphosphatase/pppGpp-phosphohydrolase